MMINRQRTWPASLTVVCPLNPRQFQFDSPCLRTLQSAPIKQKHNIIDILWKIIR